MTIAVAKMSTLVESLNKDTLLIFARHPEPGKTKTRLIPAFGPEGAAKMYTQMVDRICHELCSLVDSQVSLVALVEPPERTPDVQHWLGPSFIARPQASGNLGERLTSAFSWAFSSGAKRVIAIGTDCIDITQDIVTEAFRSLHSQDAVIGPAFDGGYYLIGLSHELPEVFENIPWSSEKTCEETLRRLASRGARVVQLEALSDIDTPEDLRSVSDVSFFIAVRLPH